MRKLLKILAIALCYFGISCNTNTTNGPSAAAKKNLEAMQGITNAFDRKDFSNLGDYIAPDAVDHSDMGDIKGLDSMKVAFTKLVEDMDTLKTETIKELADDDYVMSWKHFNGSFKKSGMGYKAGDKMDVKAIEVGKFKDGKMVEHWTMMEPADVMKMMPASPSAPTSADSTKKK
ncbi:MAG: ester cyclase [Chitinophagales bacterium]